MSLLPDARAQLIAAAERRSARWWHRTPVTLSAVPVIGLMVASGVALTLVIVVFAGLRHGNATRPPAHQPTPAAGSGSTTTAAAPTSTGDPRLTELEGQANQVLDGGTLALARRVAALRGLPVVVFVWASWCEPCQRDFPVVAAATSKYRGRVAFIGATYENRMADARGFLRGHRLGAPSYVLGGDALPAALGGRVNGVPTMLFITPAGIVKTTVQGLIASSVGLDHLIDTDALNLKTSPSPSTEKQAIALDNQARVQAQRTSSACGTKEIPAPRTTNSNAAVPAALRSVLGVERRAPTAAELSAPLTLGNGGPPGVYVHYRRGTRFVSWPGEVTFQITVVEGHWSIQQNDSEACVRAATPILEHLLAGQSSAVRTEALRIQNGYKLGPQVTQNRLSVYFSGLGGTGGPFNAANFEKHGLVVSGTGDGRSEVVGLVPDGVKSVTVTLKGGRNYARPFSRTVRVRENTFLVFVPADPNTGDRQHIVFNR